MTTSSQAGILHGDNRDIPAFYWYEKRERRLMSSADPRDLHAVQQRLSNGQGLLPRRRRQRDQPVQRRRRARHHDGRHAHRRRRRAQRGATATSTATCSIRTTCTVGSSGCSARRCSSAGRRSASGSRTSGRASVGSGCSPSSAAPRTSILRDATTWAVVASMYRGRRIIYCDYLGYDEVAHYAGPETRDAVASLAGIDRQIRQLAQAAREAPRPYQLRRVVRPRPDDGADLRERSTESGSTRWSAS